jgi:hypothetical protein
LEKHLKQNSNAGRLDICKICIWHKAEEENLVPMKKHARFCDINHKYTVDYHSCEMFMEELFEGKPNSTQTKEISLDYDGQIDLDLK